MFSRRSRDTVRKGHGETIEGVELFVPPVCVSQVPIVLIIEPDSLPNLASNLGDPRCGAKATQTAYKECISYAVKEIAKHAPGATMYIDAAHGGWLGWTQNLNIYLTSVQVS